MIEALHPFDCLVTSLGVWIRAHTNRNSRLFRVAIAGDGALGKTTVAKALSQHLDAMVIEGDGYSLGRSERSALGIPQAEDPRSFNRTAFLRDVQIIEDETAAIIHRTYDHRIGVVREGARVRRGKRRVVLLEGTCLLEPAYHPAWDAAVLLDAAEPVRRRLRTEAERQRGYGPDGQASRWRAYASLYRQAVDPWRGTADVEIRVEPEWSYRWGKSALGCACGEVTP